MSKTEFNNVFTEINVLYKHTDGKNFIESIV